MTTRSVEVEVEVAATPERVWRALTEAEELKRWFPLDARVEPGANGRIWLSWGPGVEGEAPIRIWEPPAHFRWVEQTGGGDAPVELAVDFHIEARDGATVVRLVHSGFGASAEWDDYYDGVSRGWAYFLRHLAHYLEAHLDQPRRMVWDRRAYGAPRPAVWERLLGPDGLGIVAGGATPREGDRFELALGPDECLGGTVWTVQPPFTFAGCLDILGGAPIFVELEGGGENWHCGIWLSIYGAEAERAEELQRHLTGLAGRVAEAVLGVPATVDPDPDPSA